MTQPSPEAIERKKDTLFVTDAEICRRLGLSEKLARPTILFLEDKHNFPRKHKLWGNRRYWPAVKEYLDRMGGLTMPEAPPVRSTRYG